MDDPHKPLRDDVRLLGELLGEALRSLEGEALFARVEEARALAKRAHAGDEAAFEALADRLVDRDRVIVGDRGAVAREESSEVEVERLGGGLLDAPDGARRRGVTGMDSPEQLCREVRRRRIHDQPEESNSADPQGT